MIMSLPTMSFWMLLGIPGIMLLIMLYDSWRIWTKRKD